MKYSTPRVGQRYALKRVSVGLIVKGVVDTSVDGLGFRLDGIVFLDRDCGSGWVPVRETPLENK